LDAGEAVGATDTVGAGDGLYVAPAAVGADVGVAVGATVGALDTGDAVGAGVGVAVGAEVGDAVSARA
jgi:hypothetical protein